MKTKVISWIKGKLHLVATQKGSKHAIALGIAIGFFWGFTPLFGLKTLCSFLTAWVTRANKIAALVAVTLHDLFLPIYPLFLMAGYHLGNFLLHRHNVAHPKLVKQVRLPVVEAPEDWWEDLGVTLHYLSEVGHNFYHHLIILLKSLYPMLVGTSILSLPLCVITYFATLRLLNWYERRQREKARLLADGGVSFDVTGKHGHDES
ncbi:hypothetical protein SAMN05444156_0862 [Verrucomicrobium sp. GAS474]|uniref:DUF2062 domain-containing protein n=1 Tax=Verrucomicrobium sp. GAS474 TaxID=1882831 RepID=UPI00087B345E|nr:DUF2062 domain-containing protein [Verrucomicrobium sp. GAS474]SDT93341.1 hypothetical protein SAMN05444156_0862 [Verrucomicrobium sp. GAS474]